MKNEENNELEKKNDYLKFFELNDEGLKLYAQYKKAQYLKTLKFSLLGTTAGFILSNVMELLMRRTSHTYLDIYKTFVFFTVTGVITYNGFLAATIEMRIKQKELAEKYGKEI